MMILWRVVFWVVIPCNAVGRYPTLEDKVVSPELCVSWAVLLRAQFDPEDRMSVFLGKSLSNHGTIGIYVPKDHSDESKA